MSRRRTREAADQGFAMVYAVALLAVSTAMLLLLAVYAVGEARQSGKLRQRATALSVAEGQVDVMVARMSSAAPGGPAALPCGPVTATDGAAGGPDAVTATTTVTYFDAASSQVPCPVPASAQVATALVRSVATGAALAGTAPARRVMEATVRLGAGSGPATGPGSLPRALFGQEGIRFANTVDLSGQGGRTADVYTNGNFACQNVQHIRGSLVVQGTTTMANACRVDGDVRSRGTARFDNQAAVVGGSVSVSAGDAALVPGTAVGGGVTASGTVTWDQCPARCTPGTAVPHPPVEAFPLLTWNSTTEAAWASAGWTQVVTRSDCTLLGDANEPGRWLLDNAGSLSARTILRTPCQVVLQPNNGTLALGHDLAIVADGGIRFAGTLTVRSATATARSLYLLQPTNAVTSPCALDGVQLDNQVFVDPTVTDLVYSPCNVRIANASAHNGQMYAGGTLIFDNAVTMTFRPMDLHGIPGTAPTQTYRVDILTKRENT